MSRQWSALTRAGDDRLVRAAHARFVESGAQHTTVRPDMVESTGEVFTEIARGGAADIEAALDAAHGAGRAVEPARDLEDPARHQCQIVRISDNHVLGYNRTYGKGNTERPPSTMPPNIPVPSADYNHHCDAKRIW
ncbi:hypothetical protein VSH64_09470 [Amycolatopsis rhabdoformis]|uniref:Uncharacterized protein n=1 Tax=Amycolatopsis rhabdoformis TaxID=1448059 RepID=A0ABZ1IE22_9PSEU|nr:hypothetical protein [Amycolatopsis rhabdoformis]WSE32331.1 hypothetical protein VSH64_09470 [Amycolatopsis rhabdoformis]